MSLSEVHGFMWYCLFILVGSFKNCGKTLHKSLSQAVSRYYFSGY